MSTSTNLEETAPPPDGAPNSQGIVIHAGRAISVVLYVTVAARLLSIVSQVLTASAFGVGPTMDAYTVALIVPTTISGILTTAVGAALIPVFVDYRENKGEAESMRLLRVAMTLGTLIALVVTVALAAGAPLVVTIFARQMDAPTQTLAVILLRFLMPVLLLQVLVTLVGSVLNAYGRFAVPSLAPVTITLSTIAFLLFAPSWGIYALGWGTIVGYSLNFLLLVVAYLRMGLRFHFDFSWRHPGIQRIAALSTPMLIGALMVNGNSLVDQFMASLLPPGSIASLSYAIKLVDMPSGIFYTALSTALLPIFALQVARREFTLLTTTFRQAVIFSAIILLPAGALLSSLSRPVVEIFYHHGNFSAQATDVVASAVMFLAPNIFIVTYGFINGRMYNALQDNRTLRNVAVLSLVLNAVLDYLLMQIWGVAGIAFATTLTYLIGALTLLLILNKRLQGLRLPQLGLSLGKTVVAAVFLWLTCALLAKLPQMAALPPLVQIVLLSAAGLVIYAALLLVLRVPEASQLWTILCSRLHWGRAWAKPA
ncbi:murein biosynthesis integral membrane protein MurJ [Bradyrhizobium sp. AZCC 1678]|uniref:murein biosynthesis integral membrane protein MurJ n=1 Tax=Bradyrhizobium sp. AZCC 1678 TaxID=3117030 RepID=UPI002FF0DFDB